MMVPRRRWLALANPSSGAMRDLNFRHYWLRRVRYAATKFVICDKPGDAAAIMADEPEFDGIAAMGGDGTVAEILPALDPGRHCLTVLPAGRGNSLARALGLSTMPDALEAMTHGVEQPMDLMMLTTHHADGSTARKVCASTIAVGYVAAVVERAEDFAEAGTHAYTLAGLLTGPRPSPMQLSYDGGALQTRTLTGLVISNISHVAQYRPFPRARLDDGRLHAMELDAGRIRQVANNLSMMAGFYPVKPRRSCRSMSVRLEAAGRIMADGEILEGIVEFSVDCVAGAILCNRADWA
jgi:diacylglycerol kinase (ATP)